MPNQDIAYVKPVRAEHRTETWLARDIRCILQCAQIKIPVLVKDDLPTFSPNCIATTTEQELLDLLVVGFRFPSTPGVPHGSTRRLPVFPIADNEIVGSTTQLAQQTAGMRTEEGQHWATVSFRPVKEDIRGGGNDEEQEAVVIFDQHVMITGIPYYFARTTIKMSGMMNPLHMQVDDASTDALAPSPPGVRPLHYINWRTKTDAIRVAVDKEAVETLRQQFPREPQEMIERAEATMRNVIHQMGRVSVGPAEIGFIVAGGMGVPILEFWQDLYNAWADVNVKWEDWPLPLRTVFHTALDRDV